jgi:hypothetical protein
MVNLKFAKFHCYQQTLSFVIIPYINKEINEVDDGETIDSYSSILWYYTGLS